MSSLAGLRRSYIFRRGDRSDDFRHVAHGRLGMKLRGFLLFVIVTVVGRRHLESPIYLSAFSDVLELAAGALLLTRCCFFCFFSSFSLLRCSARSLSDMPSHCL